MTLITLELSLEEVNAILDALGQRPYQDVYQLIAKLQQQAQGQLEAQAGSNEGGT